MKIWIAVLLGTLTVCFERLFRSPHAVALANELGLVNEHGKESLQIDPAASLPTASRYLVYKRGAAYNYALVNDGASYPLGVSPDSPYAIGDFLSVYRFGAARGFFLGIPAGAIAQDHLVVAVAAGKVDDLANQGNGTVWVIGRCVKACAATDIEVAYVPCTPYEITVSNGGGTYAAAGVGV